MVRIEPEPFTPNLPVCFADGWTGGGIYDQGISGGNVENGAIVRQTTGGGSKGRT